MPLTQNDKSPQQGYQFFARLGFTVIVLAFGVGGTWAYFAPLDSAAIAPGQVTVESNRKPIQHFEGGILSEIRVKESQHVKQGDVLFRLDPVRFQAKVKMIRAQLQARLAQKGRLMSERDAAPTITWPEALQNHRSSKKTAAIMAGELRLFSERRASIESQIEILSSRISQARQESAGREKQKQSYEKQAASIELDLIRLRRLNKRKLYSISKLNALEREKVKFDGEAGRASADVARAHERISESRLRIIQLKQDFTEQAATQLAETEPVIAELRQQLTVALDALDRADIRAPHDGIIQSITVFSAGAVVRPGEPLAELVPSSDALIVSARVSPLDIDNVVPGQQAQIQFPALASRGLPTIYGRVGTISADTMLDTATGQSYYLARIIVSQSQVPSEVIQKLVPGMPADTLISTGERTALEYLLSPLTDMLKTSMREQ